jgi:squalene synthase HpnC
MRVLSPDQRRHLLTLYDYARSVDQLGDAAAGDRLAQLDAFERELEAAVERGSSDRAVIDALLPTIRECALPLAPLQRLIAANRIDQHKQRYATWGELLDYCALSANPVGELVLRVFGAEVEPRRSWSDAVCSALQVIEHLQDVGEDFAAGRIYFPSEDMQKFDCCESDFGSRAASPALREMLHFEADRAQALLEQGVPLSASLRGRARMAVSGFVAGGRAALDAVRRVDFATLTVSPRPHRRDLVRHIIAVQREARRWEGCA